MPEPLMRPRRAILRQWLARADDPAIRRALDTLPADGGHGAVLIERLRFGPPETWRGWRPGLGAVAVKLWPAGMVLPPLHPIIHSGVAPLLDQGEHWRVFAWIEGSRPSDAALSAAAFAQVAEAIAALHASGQVHGDLTPANIVLGRHGAVLIDWGEDCAGTPGWHPDHAHEPRERDCFALERLRALTAAPPADGTPAAAPRCRPARE